MGAVWRAWDERLKRWVALKQIRADVTVRHGRERLWREACAAARLNHPSIVQVYDILEGTDGDWIVMELVEGKTLRRLLEEETALPPARAIKLCREITEGLVEAHAQGILHRDLKATNVIIAASGRAKILDFGLAKELPREGVSDESRDLTITLSGNVLGTCYAMSPEQALGRALDERSDLFSLGSLLYEMLTGKAPFRAETAALSLARVVEFKPPPVQRLQPAVPPEVCALVDWLLQKEPGDRPQSAAEVLAILEAAAGASIPAGTVKTFRAPTLRPEEPTVVTLAERAARFADRPKPEEGQRQSSGERRTVTIVCCGMVQLDRSSGEMGALEIEAVSEAAMTFESLGREICREFSGSLGAALNRTLWLCFGYPQAHEDDAERAIRAARELQARFAALPVSAAYRLAVRAGVHTGPAVVVIRPSVGPALQPGDTFDIATAIQSQMPAGRIGVSATSHQLLGRKFATQPLPAIHVKDLDATIDVHELGASLERESLEDAPAPPLVNREAELQILLDRFRLACSGSGQAVLIAGEAGIGKSRLVRALSERGAAEATTWLTAQGSTYTQNTPLAPIIPLLSRAIFPNEASAESSAGEKLRRLEEVLDELGVHRDYVPLLGELLSLPTEERYPPLVLSPEARRKRTLAGILALLGALAERRTVVLVIEDLHWIDPSTLELLDLLLGEISVLPLLLVGTFRPEFTAPWRHQTAVTQLNLGRLSETHAAQMIERVAEGKRLPVEVHREIVVRTDGIPLFVEELTKAVLEAAAPLREGIPFTLGSSLLARLDRLGEAKTVAQLASVIGRTFTLEQLEALSWIKGAALQAALGRLLQAEILHRRGPVQGARYVFKHALIQDAAYLSLLASDRQRLHQRLARLIQEDLPAVAEAEPELMAHHCERGGLTMEAIGYLQQAGTRAMQRSAQLEAVSHLNRALDLLLDLPATPEILERELSLRSVLGVVFAAIKGWGAPEVALNAERCVTLCRELGEHGRLIPSLAFLWAYNLLRGNRQPSIDLADEIARLAETPVQVFIGCLAREQTSFYRGQFAEALTLAEQAATLFEPNLLPELAQVFGDDSSLMPHVYRVWVLWILGAPDTALYKMNAVLATVEALRSPFLLGMALLFEMILWHELRDPERVDEVAKRLIGLANEQEFSFLRALAHVGQGWAACQRGDLAGGTAQIQTGLDLHWATGARLPRGYWLSYLIEAYLAAGRIAEGLAVIREALAMSETQLDVFFDAEVLRLQGEFLRASGDARAAEAAFRKALGIARGQGARAFELRTATSLSRLLAEQGCADEARAPLAAAYQTYREGFATRDLMEARNLLGWLSSSKDVEKLVNPPSLPG
jgi:class 3 adenylate cyclase/tRNA A-37 threonylcarbamoyl transferase component Bud32/tetratricopeptide (TPR) repeat protein